MSHWDFGRPPAEQDDVDASRSGADDWDADDDWTYPITYERDPYYPEPAAPAEPAAPEVPAAGDPQPPFPYPDWPPAADEPPDSGGRDEPRRRGRAGRTAARRRRWLIPAAVAVAAAVAGGSAALLAGGHPGTRGAPASSLAGNASAAASASPAAAPAPLTLAQAQAVLARYNAANNAANAGRSATALAAIETGSSYQIDAAVYQQQQAADTAPTAPFNALHAVYYLPRGEAPTGPRWFVVRVANAFASNPAKVTSTEYLLFTQAASGGAWRDAIEPFLLSGVSVPQIAAGAGGVATAVGSRSAAQAVTPEQLPAATAAALDGGGSAGTAVADPGNLADGADQQLWRKDVPGGSVTVVHAAASGSAGQKFALLTTGGGALVFYADTAVLTVTPPAGSALHVTIPGLYAPSQALSAATVDYLEQFAAYDPPAGGGAPRVVADYSAITGKG